MKPARPSFDVVRGAFEETHTGWVYRSDVEPVVIEPTRTAPEWIDPPRFTTPPLPAVAASRAGAPATRFAPATWLEAGLYVMTMPIAVTVGMMVMPVLWMFGPRSRR